jgi:hypothetical protein
MRYLIIVFTFAAVLSAADARAHGNNAHVWVTYGGIDAMHDCEARTWLMHEDIRPKAAIAATFPDAGYVSGGFGEPAHWEPFTQAYIDVLRAKYHDDYSSQAARESVAFMMGASAHGMEDEVFDSIFLREMEEKDHVSQDWSDPGTDFMLVVEGYTKLQPPVWYPKDDPLAALEAIGVVADEHAIRQGMNTIQIAVLGLVNNPTPDMDDQYRPAFTWTAEHYVEFKTPGSFYYEMSVIGPYFDALWHRLHGDFRPADVVVQTVPAPGERLIANDAVSVFAWPAVVFGYGVKWKTLNGDTVQVLDPTGKSVPVEIINTRWNADPTRLIQIKPLGNFKPNTQYTIRVGPGLELIDGHRLTTALEFPFTSACAGSCEALAAPVTAATCALPTAKAASSSSDGCAAAGFAVPLGLALPLVWRRRRKERRPRSPT